jgi:hypothetical protein
MSMHAIHATAKWSNQPQKQSELIKASDQLLEILWRGGEEPKQIRREEGLCFVVTIIGSRNSKPPSIVDMHSRYVVVTCPVQAGSRPAFPPPCCTAQASSARRRCQPRVPALSSSR